MLFWIGDIIFLESIDLESMFVISAGELMPKVVARFGGKDLSRTNPPIATEILDAPAVVLSLETIVLPYSPKFLAPASSVLERAGLGGTFPPPRKRP